MSSVRWCCSAFEHSYSKGGQRGAAVLYAWRDDTLQFFIQFRLLDRGSEHLMGESQTNVSFVTQFALSFCPWCGAKLIRRYIGQVDKLPIRVVAL